MNYMVLLHVCSDVVPMIQYRRTHIWKLTTTSREILQELSVQLKNVSNANIIAALPAAHKVSDDRSVPLPNVVIHVLG